MADETDDPNICPACGGDRLCGECYGTGLEDIDDAGPDCLACGGTGRCDECGGTGRQPGEGMR